jgi:carboxypeptidase Taq
MPAQTPYQQLEQEFRRLSAFRGAASVLRWDVAVVMPQGSADVRGDQLAALESECHAILISPRLSRLLERAEANSQGLDEWQLANLREMRRERERALATPAMLVSRLARAAAQAGVRWLEARNAEDFALLAPHLEEVIAMVRDRSAHVGAALGVSAYDALVDEYSPGLSTDTIEEIFRTLTGRLPALIRRTLAAQPEVPAMPDLRLPLGRQRQLATDMLKSLGFAFERGRLDAGQHSFTGGIPGDTRVTVRFDAGEPLHGLLAVLHEAGHALYDQGLPEAWRGQPVGRDRGMAVQESQALLLEMIVGRSQAFAQWLAPRIESAGGAAEGSVVSQSLYRRLTHVARSAIRVDADELTYNVHVMLRYDLEQRLLGGELRVVDLPDAWDAELEGRLGIRPASINEGCLQDVHWPAGAFGYFPSYTIGAMLAGQLHETLRGELSGFDEDLAAGRFDELIAWLRTRVHEQGSLLPLTELIAQATTRPLSAMPWLRYVESKYLPD